VLRALLRLALHRGLRQGATSGRPSSRGVGRRRREAPHAPRASPRRARAGSRLSDSAVPDVLGPGVRVVFCGINPGYASAAAGAAFANPRNDFWRLLHAAGFTPRLFEPHEQRELLDLGIGLTNAARRTTRGSSDLRAADFEGARERLEAIARDFEPIVIAFVGKAAYQGAFRERPEHGLQERTLGATQLFVLPSTSPANAAVPWDERLRWFRALRELV
jgi:TDG/mug DNA glycosylase family protein